MLAQPVVGPRGLAASFCQRSCEHRSRFEARRVNPTRFPRLHDGWYWLPLPDEVITQPSDAIDDGTRLSRRYNRAENTAMLDPMIRSLERPSPGREPIEVVERKGRGHPDTICDAIAEHVCIRLCRTYRERFGAILHHNVDKVLLVGGAARAEFGGGAVLEPIELYVAGRVTSSFGGTSVPVSEIAVEATREWLNANLPGLDVERDVRIVPGLRGGSADLTSLFSRGGPAKALANDTSCGVGFAPNTDLERIVIAAEGALNSDETKQRHPALGHDVKIMGIRRGDHVELTVACAMIGRHIADIGSYLKAKETARAVVLAAAQRTSRLEVAVSVNAADDLDRGDLFLTVTGTSAEAGDDGEVGRGNRANGLITPYRPMTMEAAAGKNPATHVGKLYSILAERVSCEVVEHTRATDAVCTLVSRIGQAVDEPQLAEVQVGLNGAGLGLSVRSAIADIVRNQCASLAGLREELLAGRLPVF
jgi:S-adenosylmethionine synthetase